MSKNPRKITISLAENKARCLANVASWKKLPKLTAEQVDIIKAENIGKGMIQYTCSPVSADSGSIYGLVIVREISWTLRHAQVIESYVDPVCRRKGVRTLIHQAMLKDFDIISSVAGTVDGEKWMRAIGYVFDEVYGHWVYRKDKE